MKRRRVLLALILGLLPSGLAAAPEPVLRMELEETEAVPGQPILLRLTVLVPTWMAKPPVYPSFEVPNLMVRIPKGGSFATSETINGETWSGISRSYRLYPMTEGTFEIPAREIELNYANPGSPDPVRTVLKTEPLRVRGVVPDGAAGLSPFLAADDLQLKETLDGTMEDLVPGSAITRSLVTTVTGVAPMVLPPLVKVSTQSGLSSYEAQPVISETENRGILSGKRKESVTYIVESGGRYRIPEIHLDWFNLTTNRIETASLDGFELVVSGDPPAAPSQAINWRRVTFGAAFAVLVLGAIALLLRLGRPAFSAIRARRRAAWEASEAYAFQQARAAIQAGNLDATMRWISLWQDRVPVKPEQSAMVDIDSSLAALGAGLYSRGTQPPEQDRWETLFRSLTKARKEVLSKAKTGAGDKALPPLNPGAAA